MNLASLSANSFTGSEPATSPHPAKIRIESPFI